jgi:hypothetical protein
MPAQGQERPGADPRVHLDGVGVAMDRLVDAAGGQGEVTGQPLP